MELLAQRISRLAESETLQMAKLSRELKEQGLDIIDLSLGEPDFDTPQHIKDAAKKAIDEGFTKYTPVAGTLELRKAICKKFKDENQLAFTPDQIVVSTGAKQSLANVMMVLLNPGDEVIVPSPYWVSYREMIKLAEARVVEVKSSVESNFKITPAQLEAAITAKTRLFCFSSPCNPSGSVYSAEELHAFARVLASHPDIFVLSDEIYEHILFSDKHHSMAQFPELEGRVIVVNGCSKAFAMTGWRIGYMGAPAWIAKACEKMQGQITSGASSISQKAALAALAGTMAPREEMRQAFRRRRDLVAGLIKNIPGMVPNHPDGAFYFFPDVQAYFGKSFQGSVIKNADDLCMYLIHHALVSVVTGKAFGDPNCIRISYATSEAKITEAFRRMQKALAELQ